MPMTKLPSREDMPAVLKALRGTKTLRQMAKKLKCDEETYRKWEAGKNYPRKLVSRLLLTQLLAESSLDLTSFDATKDRSKITRPETAWNPLYHNPKYPSTSLESYTTWAQYLRYCRRVLEYTPADIANHIRVSEGIYREYEKGRKIPERRHQSILNYLLRASLEKDVGLPEITFPVYAKTENASWKAFNTEHPRDFHAKDVPIASQPSVDHALPTLTLTNHKNTLRLTGAQECLDHIYIKILPVI